LNQVLFYFNFEKLSAETCGMLKNDFHEDIISVPQTFECYSHFKSGKFGLKILKVQVAYHEGALIRI